MPQERAGPGRTRHMPTSAPALGSIILGSGGPSASPCAEDGSIGVECLVWATSEHAGACAAPNDGRRPRCAVKAEPGLGGQPVAVEHLELLGPQDNDPVPPHR